MSILPYGGFLLNVAGLGLAPHVAMHGGTLVVQAAESAALSPGRRPSW